MTAGAGPASPFEFEAFGAATGCAVVSGALSLIAPYLTALTGALAALAVAGWISTLRRRSIGATELLRPALLGSLAGLAIGVGIFLFAAPPLGTARGLLLALTLVPIWLLERRPARATVRLRGTS